MSTVRIKAKSNASSIFQINIGDRVILKVHHSYNNTISIELEDGKTHILTFYAEGQEGESYSIEVLSPVNPPSLHRTLDADGKDFGYLKINLNSI